MTEIHFRLELEKKHILEMKLQEKGLNISDLLRTYVDSYIDINRYSYDELVLTDQMKRNCTEIEAKEKELLQLKQTNHNIILLLKTMQEERETKAVSEITPEEMVWLKETKILLHDNPQWIDGRMALYVNKFNKPIKKTEFIEVLELCN